MSPDDLASITRVLWAIAQPKTTKGGGPLKGKTTAELIEMARQLPEFAGLLGEE